MDWKRAQNNMDQVVKETGETDLGDAVYIVASSLYLLKVSLMNLTNIHLLKAINIIEKAEKDVERTKKKIDHPINRILKAYHTSESLKGE